MKKKIFDRIASYFTQSPTRFFFIAAIAAFFVLWFVNAYRDPDGFSWHDVIVESHGVLFDLLVFGILLSIYEALREKKDKIERLREEIGDYSGWMEDEAMYRIVGAIKRLNKLKISDIYLYNCFLQRANLKCANLQGAYLYSANLQGANLADANLRGANLNSANLQGANVFDTKFQGANLINANLPGLDLRWANFEGADLSSANLEDAVLERLRLQDVDFSNANLKGANLQDVDFSNANLKGANLQDANLHGAMIYDANLKEVNLQGVSLQESDSHKADRLAYAYNYGLDPQKLIQPFNATYHKDWLQNLEEWRVIGREAIIEKYYIDENNRLQLKLTPPPTQLQNPNVSPDTD